MSARAACAAAMLAMLTAGCVASPHVVPEPTAVETASFYPAQANGRADLERAIANAHGTSQRAVIVFGADWCHDSLTLARILRSPAFRAEFDGRYTVTMIDVGKPQTGAGHNLDLVARFGIVKLASTPAMVVIDGNGHQLNSAADAISWRNAGGRRTADVFAWFRALK